MIDRLKLKDMTFKDYASSLSDVVLSERSLFVKKVAEACMVDVSTVYRWIQGKMVPDQLKQQKISEITGIQVDNLFPNEHDQN